MALRTWSVRYLGDQEACGAAPMSVIVRYWPALKATCSPNHFVGGWLLSASPFSEFNPLVIGHAPRARTISAAFLNSYNDHFNDEGRGIFAKICKDYPVDYFWGLITLAKVMKVEIGGPHEFDRRRPRRRRWIGWSPLGRRRGRCWSSS